MSSPILDAVKTEIVHQWQPDSPDVTRIVVEAGHM
jgi:hypothetical protein